MAAMDRNPTFVRRRPLSVSLAGRRLSSHLPPRKSGLFGRVGEGTGMADLYSTLGVARDAGEADIKKAYRKLAKELHPDRNKGNTDASERFSKVTQAYDILTDKDKRARYDRGEIDEDGNPRAPFGFGAGGPQPGAGGFGRGANGADFEFGGEAADISELFEGL